MKWLLIILCAWMLCGCSFERKVRFRPVGVYEVALNFKICDTIYVNDYINESHYQINSWDVDLLPQAFSRIEINEDVETVMAFSGYYLGRFYHLQLSSNEEEYFLSTASFSTGKSIPLVYEKQQHYSCPEQIAKQLQGISEK